MIEFKLKNKQNVEIYQDGERVGDIFSPAGSSEDNSNCIQVCGFSEAFDLWGCGRFEGFKDIQLLFDGKKMYGEEQYEFDGCLKCFRNPCQCENRPDIIIDKFCRVDDANPFFVKREHMLEDRIIKNERSNMP